MNQKRRQPFGFPTTFWTANTMELFERWAWYGIFILLAELMNLDQAGLTNYLWATYHPSNIWMLFSAIGMGTVVLLFIYDRLLLKTK